MGCKKQLINVIKNKGDYIIKAHSKISGVIRLLGAARGMVFADSISIANIEPCRDANYTSIGYYEKSWDRRNDFGRCLVISLWFDYSTGQTHEPK